MREDVNVAIDRLNVIKNQMLKLIGEANQLIIDIAGRDSLILHKMITINIRHFDNSD
jgi:hypothetical protein